MSPRKQLGPPKGMGAAANAITAATETEDERIERLSNRYHEEQTDAPATRPSWPQPGPAPAAPAARPARKKQSKPAGMTRRSFYMPTAAADALSEAAQRIQDATHGTITKHVALGALVMAGVDQTDAVIAALRADLAQKFASE